MKASTTTGKRPNGVRSDGEPTMGRRLLFFLGFGVVVLAIVGVTLLGIRGGLNQQLNTIRHDATPVATGVTTRAFVSINDKDAFPMGIAAAPDGTLYLTRFGNGTISTVSADGTLTPYLTVGNAAGTITVAPDNTLYVIAYTAPNESAVGTLFRVERSESGNQLKSFGTFQSGFSLFSSIVSDGEALYATNPSVPEIVRVAADGTTRPYWVAPVVGTRRPQLTGITYDLVNKRVVVSDSGTGSIYGLTPPTVADQLATSTTLFQRDNFDGRSVAVDDRGRVLIGAWENDNGSLYRIETDRQAGAIYGTLTQLATGFRAPTALVYQAGKVYLVNSDALAIMQGNGFLQPTEKLPFTVDEIDLTNAG